MKAIPLGCLLPGECAEITDVHGSTAWVCRMAELGLGSGSQVRVICQGQPCLVAVGNSRLSLRGDELEHIFVRPVGGP